MDAPRWPQIVRLKSLTYLAKPMQKNTGHIIRICGLVIEMLGVWAVYNASGAADQARLSLPGGTTVPWHGLPWASVSFFG